MYFRAAKYTLNHRCLCSQVIQGVQMFLQNLKKGLKWQNCEQKLENKTEKLQLEELEIAEA